MRAALTRFLDKWEDRPLAYHLGGLIFSLLSFLFWLFILNPASKSGRDVERLELVLGYLAFVAIGFFFYGTCLYLRRRFGWDLPI